MNAYQQVGRADALYFSVAITVTIIELAIVATTPSLGTLALEYALIAQLAISILVEFGIAYMLVSWLGVVHATHAGFAFKAISCCLFFGGVVIASHSVFYGWVLILGAFLFDSMGTGLLKAAFRPAYSAMHYSVTGKPADYISNLRGFGKTRLTLPCILVLLIGAIHFYLPRPELISAMFLVVLACRCTQILLAKVDLRKVKNTPTPCSKQFNDSTISVFKAFKSAPSLWACYTVGTLFESVILMYGIGLIYRYKGTLPLPEAVTWMGASAVSLAFYLISYAGASYVVRYWSYLQNSKLSIIAFSWLAIAIAYFLILDPHEVGHLAGLLGFCFFASVSALLLIRHASTQFLLIFSEQDAAKIFIWAELAANIVLIIIVGAVATLIGPEKILLAFGILFSISTAATAVFLITRR